MVKRQERYINDIEDIRGTDKNKKQLRTILAKFKSLQNKAAPRKEYSQMLLGSLKNIYKEEKDYGNKFVSLKNIFSLFWVVTSFAFIVSAVFLFDQSRHVEQKDFIHFSQEGWQIESLEEADFWKVLEEVQTDIWEYSADIGEEDTASEWTHFESDSQKSVWSDELLHTKNLKTKAIKESSPLLSKAKRDELLSNWENQTSAPEMLRTKSVQNQWENEEKRSEKIVEHQENTSVSIDNSELTSDVPAEFFMKWPPFLEGEMSAWVQSMMWDEGLIQKEHEFRDICLAHSWIIDVSTMTCVFDNGESCNIENIFEDSLKPCEYLYGKESVRIEKKSNPEIDINLQELMESFGQ